MTKVINNYYKKNFFKNYFENIYNLTNSVDDKILNEISKKIYAKSKKGGKIIIVGNGGSAAIASHISIDFNNAAGIKAVTFNESSLITCFSNDYGYENWVRKALSLHINSEDIVILLSSSGNSMNIVNAARFIKKNFFLITLTGFEKDNKLKKYGKFNLYCQSKNYNFIEATHFLWLLAIIDRIVLIKNKKN
jgi:D-sedoheptulose 7-phosphate isomerase